MSYQEKRIVASFISGLLILVSYCIYGVTKYQAVGEGLLTDLKFWATLMLVTIGLGIAIMMVIQLVLHIYLAISSEVKKEISKRIAGDKTCAGLTMSCDDLDVMDKEDEMDKLITLKSSKYSFGVIGFGFVVSLVTLYYHLPPAVMLNTIFVSLMVASLIEGLLQLRFYRNGIHHG
jgi:hypothetical protein